MFAEETAKLLTEIEIATQLDTEPSVPLKANLGWYVLSTRESSHVKSYKYREILETVSFKKLYI